LYEEFNVDRRQICTLEFLLSDGSLVKLRFRDFHFGVGKQILPHVNGHATAGRAVPGDFARRAASGGFARRGS
jgi:hypothetical protein